LIAAMDQARFRFLYRQGEGAVGRREWLEASAAPIGIAVALTIVWLAIMPREPRDLAHESLIDWRLPFVYGYLMLFVFALILCAVAEYFVSAKRFADRAKAPSLAGLAPFCLLLAGAAHWYQPRSEGAMPGWGVWAFDALALAVLVWNVVELGFLSGRRRL
jgi:low temperature requirement protein LtrA